MERGQESKIPVRGLEREEDGRLIEGAIRRREPTKTHAAPPPTRLLPRQACVVVSSPSGLSCCYFCIPVKCPRSAARQTNIPVPRCSTVPLMNPPGNLREGVHVGEGHAGGVQNGGQA